MKHTLYFIVLATCVFGFNSCEQNDFKDLDPKSENPTQLDSLAYQNEVLGSESNGIYAMTINDGVSSNCTNNILVFPDWETFKNTAKALDDQWELNIDNMNKQAGTNLTDEQYEAYIKSVGFNEDQPYLDFENNYKFCSLRKYLDTKEDQWLSRRTDEEDWNEAIKTDPDPDSHFIWDEERPLFNPQSEVIVLNKEGKKIIYKFYPDGYVMVRNMNEKELQYVNLGGPATLLDLSWTSQEIENPEYGNNPGNIGGIPSYYGGGDSGPPGSSNKCKFKNRTEKYFYPAHGKRIKAVNLFRKYEDNIFSPIRAKSKTKHYNKWHYFVGSTWVKGPSKISAGLYSNYKLNCDNIGPGYPLSIKQKFASKVKKIWDYGVEINEPPEIKKHNLYSVHKRRGYTKTIDLNDGHVL